MFVHVANFSENGSGQKRNITTVRRRICLLVQLELFLLIDVQVFFFKYCRLLHFEPPPPRFLVLLLFVSIILVLLEIFPPSIPHLL